MPFADCNKRNLQNLLLLFARNFCGLQLFVTGDIAMILHRYQTGHRAFTLIELLTVIAIIGVLAGITLPAIQSARETARRTQCSSSMRQIGVALLAYEVTFKALPAGSLTNRPQTLTPVCQSGQAFRAVDVVREASLGAGMQGTSWMVAILPQIEQANLYNAWDFKTSVKGNKDVASKNIPLFYCPSRRNRVTNMEIMFEGWATGGNDYGGCVGAVNG